MPRPSKDSRGKLFFIGCIVESKGRCIFAAHKHTTTMTTQLFTIGTNVKAQRTNGTIYGTIHNTDGGDYGVSVMQEVLTLDGRIYTIDPKNITEVSAEEMADIKELMGL